MLSKKNKATKSKKNTQGKKTNTRCTRSTLHILDGLRSASAIGTLAWSTSDGKHGLLATGISEVVSEGLAIIIALITLGNEKAHENKHVKHQLSFKLLSKLLGLAGGIMMIIDSEKNSDSPTVLSYVGIGVSAAGMFFSKLVPAYYEPTNLGYQQIEAQGVAPNSP